MVGNEIFIGQVKLRVHELCEPCKHLQQMLNQNDLVKNLIHKAGLRCEILTDGKISVNDEIQKEIEAKHASILDERPVPDLLETADLIDSLKDLKAPVMGKLYEEKVKEKPDLNKKFTDED